MKDPRKEWLDTNMNQMCENLEKSNKVPFMTNKNSREVEEWEKEFDEQFKGAIQLKNKPDGVTVTRLKHFIHQELQKAREEERKIIKLRIDYDRRKSIPAEETVNDIYDSIELKNQSKLDQPNK